MNLSRRSFLKLTGLSAAVVGAAALVGCSNPLTPNLTIIYQEEKSADGSYAFTGSEAHLLAGHKKWENGRKTGYSQEKFITDIMNDAYGYEDVNDAMKKITEELAKDYDMTGMTVKNCGNPSAVRNDVSVYTVTITFKVVAGSV